MGREQTAEAAERARETMQMTTRARILVQSVGDGKVLLLLERRHNVFGLEHG